MGTLEWFKHNCRSRWTPIFKCISRTHLAYNNSNGASIYHQETSWPIILVLCVRHVAMMLNQVPGRLGLKLTTSFELVHNSKPHSKTWFELLSIGYFNHDTDNSESRSKLQAHTLYVIKVGWDDRSNSMIFYNPITSIYYCPPAFRLD